MEGPRMNPRLLLVEDEPVSLAFLGEATSALPARVDCAASVSQALAMAEGTRFDGWLLDANLPDGRGIDLLARLRALGHPAFALAHTASHDPAELDALREAGFDRVVSKPLPVGEWQAAIREAMGLESPAHPGSEHWDDEAALRSVNGNPETLRALRGLFLEELPRQRRVVEQALAGGEIEAARAELHRLKAGCGFVGAFALRETVDALHARPDDPGRLQAFDAMVDAVIAAPR